MSKEDIRKLLFIVHSVDYDHPRQRFICRWLEQFSKYHERVDVICQYKGRTDELPDNIHVHSLGRGLGATKVKQIIRFIILARKYGQMSDAIFVHNYPGWVIIGKPMWKDIPVFFWHCNKERKVMNYYAGKLCDRIFTQSKYSFPYPMPEKTDYFSHGIDIQDFKPKKNIKNKDHVIIVGRLSPEKRVSDLVKALSYLESQTLEIITAISNEQNKRQLDNILEMIKKQGLEHRVSFRFNVPNKHMSKLYQEAAASINLCETGALDKVVFESMAVGTPPIVVNKAFEKYLGNWWNLFHTSENPKSIAKSIKQITSLSAKRKGRTGRELRKIAEEKAGNQQLIKAFYQAMIKHVSDNRNT